MSAFETTPLLHDLCTAIIDCPHFTPLWTDQGDIVLRNENIRFGKLDLSKPSYTNEENFLARTQRALPSARDLVITREAPMGEVCMIPDGLRCCLGQRMVLLRPNVNIVDPSYLLYALQSEFVQKQIRVQGGTGSTVSNLRIPVLSALKIPAPPTKTEQRAIAAALTDADALIDSLEQLLAKKRQIKQGAMQELLTGKRRLPGFSGGWCETTLFELAERKKELFDDGDWIEAEHIRSEGIRLIQTGNIGICEFLEKSDKKYIDENSFNRLKCKALQTGDLLICRLADPAGRACILPDIGDERIVTSVDVTIFRPSPLATSREFLVQVFSRPEWFQAVSELSGGTTHKRISRGTLGRMNITMPSLPEQTAIAEILSDMDADIAETEARLIKARDLKQAMAQALLTGRVRLVEGAAA